MEPADYEPLDVDFFCFSFFGGIFAEIEFDFIILFDFIFFRAT